MMRATAKAFRTGITPRRRNLAKARTVKPPRRAKIIAAGPRAGVRNWRAAVPATELAQPTEADAIRRAGVELAGLAIAAATGAGAATA